MNKEFDARVQELVDRVRDERIFDKALQIVRECGEGNVFERIFEGSGWLKIVHNIRGGHDRCAIAIFHGGDNTVFSAHREDHHEGTDPRLVINEEGSFLLVNVFRPGPWVELLDPEAVSELLKRDPGSGWKPTELPEREPDDSMANRFYLPAPTVG